MAELKNDGELVLSETDKVSATWRRIEAHLVAKRDLLRRRNDNDLDEKQTARTRATIKFINELLAAGESRD